MISYCKKASNDRYNTRRGTYLDFGQIRLKAFMVISQVLFKFRLDDIKSFTILIRTSFDLRFYLKFVKVLFNVFVASYLYSILVAKTLCYIEEKFVTTV